MEKKARISGKVNAENYFFQQDYFHKEWSKRRAANKKKRTFVSWVDEELEKFKKKHKDRNIT